MIPGLAPTENARVMDADDIEGMVEAYVQAARRAVDEDFPHPLPPYLHGGRTGTASTPGTNVELCRPSRTPGVNAFDITAGMQCCFELMTPPTCMPKA